MKLSKAQLAVLEAMAAGQQLDYYPYMGILQDAHVRLSGDQPARCTLATFDALIKKGAIREMDRWNNVYELTDAGRTAVAAANKALTSQESTE